MATTGTARKKRSKTKRTVKKTASKKGPAAKSKAKKTTRKKTAAKTAPQKKPAAKKAAKKTASKAAAPTGTARRSRTNVMSGPGLGSTYQPSSGEPYMSKKQLEHFRQKLVAWKEEISADIRQTINTLKDDSAHPADPNDRATQESEFALELRTRDRELKLLRKINQALSHIEDGSYGYCEETGEEIGIARLEIRPVATLCVEAQERRERAERSFADFR